MSERETTAEDSPVLGHFSARRLALRSLLRAAEQGDREVAVVVARYAGAALGLFAFTITIVTGLLAQNPVEVTLSRSLLALLLFCLLGLVLGTAANMVITEFETSRQADIREKYRSDSAEAVSGGPDEESSEDN